VREDKMRLPKPDYSPARRASREAALSCLCEGSSVKPNFLRA
jgi:hypothetical protein